MDHIENPVKHRNLPEQTRLQIFTALTEIRFGSIEIVIHDGKIVQIERKEKIRLT